MKTNNRRSIALFFVSLLLVAGSFGVQAQTTITKANTTTMNLAADWGGTAPTNFAIGQFTSTISAPNAAALTLGGNITLAGLLFTGAMNGPVIIANTGGFTDTLDTSWYANAVGIDMSGANQNVTFNNATKLLGSQAWNVAGGRTLTISGGLTTIGSGVDFNSFGGTLNGTSMTNVNGILGPWATTFSGNAYATVSGGAVSAFSGGIPLPIFNASANTNYTVDANVAVLAPQSVNTIQANGTATISGNPITVGGILNPGNNLTFSGGITIGPKQELVFAGSGTTTMNGVIANNAAGASGLTYNGFGSGTLNLRAGNTYSGNIVINSGTVSVANSQNNGNLNAGGLGNPNNPAGRTVTINNGGILSLDTSGGNDIANGSSGGILLRFIINPGGLVRKTQGNATVGPITLNGGTLSGASANLGQNQYAAFEFGSDITVAGNTPSTITSDGAGADNSTRMNLTVNAAANAPRTFFVADVTGDANPDLITSIIFANSGNNQNAAALIKAGVGTMTLSGSSTYSGGTIVSNGTLVVNNNLNGGSGTGTGSVTVLTNATLTLQDGKIYGAVTVNGGIAGGFGTITNNVTVNTGGRTFPGGGLTTTLGANLTYNTGGEADFALANTFNGVNDQIILDGNVSGGVFTTLSGSGAKVGIKVTDLVGTNLDTTADYVLINNLTGTNNVGIFAAAPIFLGGLTPTNAANFYVVTTTNQVVLHFSQIAASSGFASPNPAIHNQLVTFSVNASSTAPGAMINSVILDASPIGGSSTLQLFLSSGNTYTNSVVVSPTVAPGNTTMFVTVIDSLANTNSFVSIPLTIIPVAQVWNGASPTNTWATPTNWVSGVAPLIGDLLTFAGTSNTTPNMESSYSIGSLTFSTNAAGFNITNSANTLTLTGGVTNNSTNTQVLSVPISLVGVVTFNAASNNMSFNNPISGTGGVTVTGGSTNVFNTANTYTGPTTVNGNLILANGNAISGSTAVTLNNNSKLLLRSDANTAFATGTTNSILAQNASTTLNFDVNSVSSGTGRILSLTNILRFPNNSSQTINVRGNSTYTLGLGQIQLVTTSHTPYFTLQVNTVSPGPNVVIEAITTGDWGNYVNFTGGGTATVNGPLSNTSNGSMNLLVNNATVTLKGPTVKFQTGDAYRYDVIAGTLVLDNSSALINNTTGTGLVQSYFILGPTTNIFLGNGFSPTAGVLVSANNSTNATVYLGGDTNLTGGLSVDATVPFNVSDGANSFTNSGVMTIGGQNTSGTNTYNNQIILGLTANRGKSVTLVATGAGVVEFSGGIMANGTDTTAGVTVGDATHSGKVAFIGSNPSTYAGGTIVTNATLRVDNTSGSGTGTGVVTINSGGKLGGSGTVSSSVTVNSGGSTLPGSTLGNAAGVTTTISGNLTVNPGGEADFNLSSSSGSGNDKISMNPFSSLLIGTNAKVGIRLTSGSVLDTSDYTLIDNFSGNFTGVFTNKPTWLGATPANPNNYSIVAYGDKIILHYSASGIVSSGSVTPNPAFHGQTVQISVTATSAGHTFNSPGSITVDASPIGGSSSLVLVSAGGNIYTNSVSIGNNIGVGVETLLYTATDDVGNSDTVPIAMTTIPVGQIWSGLGGDNQWVTTLNWFNNQFPAAGDMVTFAGTTRLTPNLDNNYTIRSVTFTNGAGSFNITNANNTLTLLSAVTNLSANVQTFSVPVSLSGPSAANPSGVVTLNAASNNIVLKNPVSAAGGLLAIGATGTTNFLAADNSITGTLRVNSGTLVLSGNNALTDGLLSIGGGTLAITGAGQLSSGNYGANITNNGTLNYSGTNNWIYTKLISGTGGLIMNSPVGTVWTIGPGVANTPYTYTGPTVVNSGELDLDFDNQPTSGIYLSSGLTINSNGVVAALRSSALTGYTVQTVNMPVTINAGGKLTVPNTIFGFSAHIYGVVNLNGGTIACDAATMQQYGGWELNNQINVGGGIFTSTISDPEFVINQTGGTVFNVTNGATPSGIDLNITGAFVRTTGANADTGVILKGNGTMQLGGLNTYRGSTTISNGATLILGTSGQLNTTGTLFGSDTLPAASPGTTTYTGNYGANFINNGTFISKTTNSQALTGVMSGNGTNIITSGSTLILAGASTFTGSTIVTNGTLLVTNSTGSATGSGTIAVNNGGYLGGFGGKIAGNVTFNTGGKGKFNLDSTFNSALNDQITFNGGNSLVTPNLASVAINLLGGDLDQTTDYVLMNYLPGTIANLFSNAPVWLGTVPSNPSNYSIVVKSNAVVLHYAVGGFVISGSSSPNPTTRSQSVTFTVNASGFNPISSVTLDASSIGGSSSVPMVFQSGTTWTASVFVAPTSPAGGGVLPVTVLDNVGNPGISSIALTVLPGIEIWNGGGSPNNAWSLGANWVGGANPVTGDILTFAGSTQTTPNMDASYTIASLTFSNNAASFNITNSANTLTVNGGITNNSANTQTLSVPINVTGSQVFNAAAGNIVVNNPISGSGGVIGTGAATNILAGNNSYTGATTVNGGTLVLSGNEAITAGFTINSGRLAIGGAGILNGGNFSPTIVNNGTFLYNSTAAQTFSGVISGSGALTIDTTNTVVLSAASTYTGNIIINSGFVSHPFANNALNITATGLGNPQTAGRTVTVNSNAILSFDGGGGNDLGNAASSGVQLGFIINQGGLVRLTLGNTPLGPVTLNGGTLTCTSNSGGSQLHFGTYYLNGNVTVGGTSPSTISSTSTSLTGFDINLVMVTAGNRMFTVADVTGDSTSDLDVSAPLGNGSNAAGIAATLVKAGPGTMTLTASNLYTGGTIVTNGTLLVNNLTGSGTGSGAVTVSNATLGGKGIILGAVTIQSTGKLAPGAATNFIGNVLIISNNLTLASGSITTNAISHNNQTNDQIVVSGTLTYGGTLTVRTNAGDGPLVAGDTFKLFRFVTPPTGTFSATNLPALDPSLAWSVTLSVDGNISVVSASPAPVASFSGSPTNIFVTQSVLFINTSTGTFTNSAWDFGDGNLTSNTTGGNVTNTYATANNFTVKLIVTGPGGSSTNTKTAYILVKPKPVIGSTTLSGGSLILSGTTGVPLAQYRILTTTNLTLPLASWTPVRTNVFDASGNFNYTNTSTTGTAGFYILVSP